ncbi:MAG: TIGR00730 family Rossman fold protein [Eubacteriales bacterium]|nr:TIGR00730 family Rossman fold protein [Eubacteriales bacterium]
MNICVFGASSSDIDTEYILQAEILGRKMAQQGHTLVFGGGATGLMGAVADGIKKEKGKLIGVSPEFFNKPGILDQECTEFIWTKTMRERKQIMEERSDAIVVLPGGIGTYEEFMEMLTLKQLGQTRKPIILYNICGYYDIMEQLLKHTAQKGFMDAECLKLCRVSSDPDEVLELIKLNEDFNLIKW